MVKEVEDGKEVEGHPSRSGRRVEGRDGRPWKVVAIGTVEEGRGWNVRNESETKFGFLY